MDDPEILHNQAAGGDDVTDSTTEEVIIHGDGEFQAPISPPSILHNQAAGGDDVTDSTIIHGDGEFQAPISPPAILQNQAAGGDDVTHSTTEEVIIHGDGEFQAPINEPPVGNDVTGSILPLGEFQAPATSYNDPQADIYEAIHYLAKFLGVMVEEEDSEGIESILSLIQGEKDPAPIPGLRSSDNNTSAATPAINSDCDILYLILGYLDEKTRATARDVCVLWRKICEHILYSRRGTRGDEESCARHILNFMLPGERLADTKARLKKENEVTMPTVYTLFMFNFGKLALLRFRSGDPDRTKEWFEKFLKEPRW